jgi:hypothetical protein
VLLLAGVAAEQVVSTCGRLADAVDRRGDDLLARIADDPGRVDPVDERRALSKKTLPSVIDVVYSRSRHCKKQCKNKANSQGARKRQNARAPNEEGSSTWAGAAGRRSSRTTT